jgi:hypothetical protein
MWKLLLPETLADLSEENEYGITLISLDEDYRRRIEPGAASYLDRLASLRRLHDRGCKMWVSVEPYPTPNLIKQDLDEILEAISFTDKIIFGRMNYNKEASSYARHRNFYQEQAQLDNVLWRDTDHIQVKKLWEYLSTYCYLPRLANEDVLTQAIQVGLNSAAYFAFASGVDGARYIDMKFNQYVGIIEKSGYLVKISIAQKQLDEEEAKRQADAAARAAAAGATMSVSTSSDESTTTYSAYTMSGAGTPPCEVHEDPMPTQPVAPKNRRFFMSADLDTTRINRDVQKYVEEIIQHLTSVDGAKVKVSLEVEADADDGFTQQTVRTISENCRTLRVRDSGFEE